MDITLYCKSVTSGYGQGDICCDIEGVDINEIISECGVTELVEAIGVS